MLVCPWRCDGRHCAVEWKAMCAKKGTMLTCPLCRDERFAKLQL